MTRHQLALQLCFGSVFLALTGCSVLFPKNVQQATLKIPHTQAPAPLDTIALEVYIIDRRADDPWIGDSLWESLHAASSIDLKTREHLLENGFRVGVSAARPPRPLTVLLSNSNGQDPTRRTIVQPYTVPSGQETWIVANELLAGTNLSRQGPTGETQQLTIDQGQAILKVQASRVEEGWAELVLIPEIQHGMKSLKPTAVDEEWTFRNRRQALTLFENRFAVELNIGEILVIGMTEDAQTKMAGHFFNVDETNGLERLMMIRIADMQQVKPKLVTHEDRE